MHDRWYNKKLPMYSSCVCTSLACKSYILSCICFIFLLEAELLHLQVIYKWQTITITFVYYKNILKYILIIQGLLFSAVCEAL